MKLSWIPALLLLIPSLSFGYTPHQVAISRYACRIASPLGLCETFTAILMEESTFCLRKYNEKGPAANGCGQIHLTTANSVLRNHTTAARLRRDDYFNVRVSLKYLIFCFKRFDGDWPSGVLCYNKGDGYVSSVKKEHRITDPYVRSILKYMLMKKIYLPKR